MSTTEKEIKKKPNKLLKTFRLLAAIVVWLYFIISIFLFNLDVFFVSVLGSDFSWLIRYKFFVFISVTSIVWLIFDSKHLFLNILYILFFSFNVIIRFLWKKWATLLIFLPAFHNYFSTTKLRFV